jgi:hypothetical protein
MRLLNASAIEAAERFIWLNGRLIDRHRFAYLFRGAEAAPVVDALRPYQNADGGFGNALEPDLRGPVSQPQPVEVALHTLDEAGTFDDPMVARACDYLAGISTPEGGVTFVLPSVRPYPRAPWWESVDDPPASLNPTGPISGLLAAHGVDHPWVAPAVEFCWSALDRLEEVDPYLMRAVVAFLDRVPDRARAETVFDRVGQLIVDRGLAAFDPAEPGETHSPLDFAHEPSSLARRLFPDDVIEAHLDALVAAQGEDGSWPFNWPAWTPITSYEWRSVVTIEALKKLRAYGRFSQA